MKKNIIYIIGALIVIALILLGIFLFNNKGTENSIKFKQEYEAVNGKENSAGKVHREVKISKNNPYVKVDPKDIVK